MAAPRMWQLSEVSLRIGLSLRTIRHYEDLGLLTPAQPAGRGSRAYSTVDLDRLLMIRQMRPLEFSVAEMADLLDIVERLTESAASPIQAPDVGRLLDRMEMYREATDHRCQALREQLVAGTDFAGFLEMAIWRLHQRHRSGDEQP